MASIDRSDPVILGHVLAEHHELFCQMMAVRSAFADKAAVSQGRVDATLVALHVLREHLRCHFEKEEEGGFLEESIARMPRLGPAVAAIMKQHPFLLAELDALIKLLSAGDSSPATWEQASRVYECFAAHMQAHERSENAVVQEGYNEDLGLLD
jgi:hypothetical protein